MAYYFNPLNEGLILASSLGDGYSINLKWTVAYPKNKNNKIAYHIYFSTQENFVFSEGPKYISTDNSTNVDIHELTPGQLYHFAVRAVEYSPIIFDISELPRTFNNLAYYPETILVDDILKTALQIPVMDISEFPNKGVIQIGYELINYSSKDSNTNEFLLNNVAQRGFFSTKSRLHNVDGYDGDGYRSTTIRFTLGREETNTRIFQCQSRFEYPTYSYTQPDGYKQVRKDLLTSDLSGSDAFNQGFPEYDYTGWHRTDPVSLLTGNCEGSYFGGEMFCADGYDGVGRVLRGLSVQDQNNQRQEMLLNLTGEPVCLLRRQRTGIVCSCFTPNQEYPDDRCPKCFVPGTLIRTELGFRPIEDIKVGEKVLSSDGKYYPVLEIFENDFDGYLKSINASTTSEPILSTPDHPFLTLRGSHKTKIGCGPKCNGYIKNGDGNNKPLDIRKIKSGKWHARCTIKGHKRKVLGSFVEKSDAIEAIINYKNEHLIPGHTLEFDEAKNIFKNDWLVNKWNKTISDKEKIIIPEIFTHSKTKGPAMKRFGSTEFDLDEEFMWISGIYLAEGSAGKRSIVFALHKKEINFAERIINFFKKYNFNASIRNVSENGIVVTINSTTLSSWFPYLFGSGCQNKKIPEEFMNLPNNKTMSLVNGVFDGDGSKSEQELAQTSKILSLQITELLHRNNKKPLARNYQSNILTPSGNKRKKVYLVNYEKESNPRNNRVRSWQFHENLLARVRETKDIYYNGKVYNLRVAGDNTYVVQNILVHNCNGSGFVTGYQQFYNPRRSDGRILVRFSPSDEDLVMEDAGLESTFSTECWTLTVPTIKDRDIIVRFDQDDNEEYRYEVLYVNRNKTLVQLQGAQKFKVERIRKYDKAYQIKVFRNTSTIPSSINTSISSGPGIPPHVHSIRISENITNLNQINQITSVEAGHSHIVQNGVVIDVLDHTHTIIIP